VRLADVLSSESKAGTVLLVDCLTLWLSNIMLAGHDAESASEQLAAAIAESAGPLILVSNEVGSGVVPATPLGRSFRDRQGWLNQAVAACCDAVVVVTAGCPQLVKPAPAFQLALR
jgi:adenosylcobinamide kinase/adenosylcobinamide-phosphate guanylyltransferase